MAAEGNSKIIAARLCSIPHTVGNGGGGIWSWVWTLRSTNRAQPVVVGKCAPKIDNSGKDCHPEESPYDSPCNSS